MELMTTGKTCTFVVKHLHAYAAILVRIHIVPQLDPQLRAVLLDAARELKPLNAVDGGVYVQTQGPRFETKAEISFLQGVGDVVGMTGAAEVRPSSRRSNCTY